MLFAHNNFISCQLTRTAPPDVYLSLDFRNTVFVLTLYCLRICLKILLKGEATYDRLQLFKEKTH